MIGQRFFRRLRARSAYAMLMVSYVGLLVCSMVFASVSYVRLYHSAQKRAEEQAYAQLRQAAYVINGYVESVRQSVMSFCMNEHVASFIYTRAPLTSEDYYRMKQVISEVAGVCSANPYLDSLFLYVQDIDSVLGAYNRMSTEDYYAIYLSFADQSLEQWRNFLQNTGYFSAYPARTRAASGQRLIPFALSLPLVNAARGAAVAYMDVARLEDVFAASGLLEKGAIVVEERGEQVCVLGNAAFIDQDWPEIQTPAWNSIQGEPYLMVSIPGEDEWRYRCIVPAGNSLAEVASTKNYIVIMLLVEVVGGALLSLALVRANYNPLRHLIRRLGIAPDGAHESKNEYEQIFRAADALLTENQDLICRLRNLQPMLYLSLLSQVLRGAEGINKQALEEYGISLPKQYFSVLLIRVGGEKENEARAVLGVSLMGILESWFAERVPCYALECASDTIALLLNHSAPTIEEIARAALQYVGQNLRFVPMAGLGGAVEQVEVVHKSYQQAQEALDYAVAWHKNGITRFADLSPVGNCVFSQVCEQELMGKLRLGDAKSALTLLRQMFLEAQGEPLAQVQIMAFGVMNACLRLLMEWKLPTTAMAEEGLPNLRLAQLSSPEALLAKLAQMIQRVADIARQMRENSYVAVGANVARLLEEQYPNSDLSLTTVAATLGLNASYLSHIFKQQTGESFVNALNEVRLKNACRLLQTTNLSIQAVAERCGYTSAGYFNRVFKKKFGITPGQFRGDAPQ